MMAPRNFGPSKKRLNRTKAARARAEVDKEDPKYWEGVLQRSRLSMERGRHKWLAYGHTLSAHDYDGVRTYATAEKDTGSD